MPSHVHTIPNVPFIFVRHGQTGWNVEGRMQGHTDIPLNDNGLVQADAICQTLAHEHIDVLVSSPLIRTRQTAEPLSRSHHIPITFDDRLKERSFGSWEGLITKDIKRQLGIPQEESFTPYLPSDAEQWPETCLRVSQVFTDYLTKHTACKIVFVSHGANFRALVEVLTGVRYEAQNGLPYFFTPHENSWRISTPDNPDILRNLAA